MSKCKAGYYYCYTDKKCKPISKGMRVTSRYFGNGKDPEEVGIDKPLEGNGNENGNGNGNGGGVSEGWSEKYKKSINCNNPKGFSQKAHCQGRKKKMTEEKKDHEYSMARSELKTINNATKRLQKKMGKKGEGELKAWVQSKITKAADYIDTAADYVTNEETVKEEGLRDWFGKSKSKDGKRGWVNVVTGDSCASDKPGEGIPKCVSSEKRASMSKKERLAAAAAKRREDPGQQEKTGASKPTMVKTDRKVRKEEMEVTEAKDKPGKGSGKKDACYHKVKSRYSVWPSAYASGALVKCRKVGAANWGNKNEEWVVNTAAEYLFNEGLNEDGVAIFIEELGLESFVEFVYDLAEDIHLTEERAARRRKSGKSYEQVKAEIDAREKAKAAKKSVKTVAKPAVETAKKQQPKKRPILDAIARQVTAGMKRHQAAMSAARETGKTISKAAKVGAKGAQEFGKGFKSGVETAGKVAKVAKKAVSENYQYSDWREDFKAMEYEFIDIIEAEPLVVEGHPMYDPERTKKATSLPAINPEQNPRKNKTNLSIGRSADAGEPNADRILKKRTGGASLPSFKKEEVDKRRAPAELVARLSARREGEMAQDGPNKPAYDAKQRILAKTKAKRMGEEVESIDEGQKCWKGYEKKGTKKMFGKTYNNCVKKEENEIDEAKHTPTKSDLEANIGGGNLQKLSKKASKRIDYDVDGDVDPNDKVEKKTGDYGEELPTPFGKFRTGDSKKVKVKKEEFSDWRTELDEGAAWTKKAGKSESGGLNEKGRKSYERENPGSDLKAPSKKVGNKRRASFCARMKGMKKKLTSAKTANDPDSRINKSLRAWNC